MYSNCKAKKISNYLILIINYDNKNHTLQTFYRKKYTINHIL